MDVEFLGGPLADENHSMRKIHIEMANIKFREWSEKPPANGVGWWFIHWEIEPVPGSEPKAQPHYYRMRPAIENGEIVADYGGTEHPTDHTHDHE